MIQAAQKQAVLSHTHHPLRHTAIHHYPFIVNYSFEYTIRIWLI